MPENSAIPLFHRFFPNTGFVWALENLESPGIVFWYFPGLESPGKRLLVLKSSGNLLNSGKNMTCMADSTEVSNIEILGVKVLMRI